MDIDTRLEEAKKLMEWGEEQREPTTLEYLRYYKSGIIGEVHIEAQIEQALLEARLDELCCSFAGKNWTKEEVDMAVDVGLLSQQTIDRIEQLTKLLKDKNE